MAESKPKTASDKGAVTARQVSEFLKANPDFIWQNPDLLLGHDLPAQKFDSPQILDFQKALLGRFRKELKNSHDENWRLLEFAYDSNQRQARILAAAVKLFACNSWHDFKDLLSTDLPVWLDLDVVGVVAISNQPLPPALADKDIRVISPDMAASFMKDNVKTQLGRPLGKGASKLIFAEQAGLVASQALIRIDLYNDTTISFPAPRLDLPPVIIGFGSRDEDHFHEGLATDHVHFLSYVIILKLIEFSRAPDNAS